MKIKEEFTKLPVPLKKEVLARLFIGGISLLIFAAILISTRDFRLCFPCLILSVFLLINCCGLLANCIDKEYMCLAGYCTEVQTVGFHKRIKAVKADINGIPLRIQVKRRVRNVTVGDQVELYVSTHTPVYEQDGIQNIYSYYAMEIRKEVLHDV